MLLDDIGDFTRVNDVYKTCILFNTNNSNSEAVYAVEPPVKDSLNKEKNLSYKGHNLRS